MKLYDWLVNWAYYLWTEKWPWMTKTSHDRLLYHTLASSDREWMKRIERRDDVLEAQAVAQDLTVRLSRAHAAMQCASRQDPGYARLVQHMMRVDLHEPNEYGDFYIFSLLIDRRAPYLFGNDDLAAWEHYLEVLGERVKAEMRSCKFVVGPSGHLSQPLTCSSKST